VSELAGAQNAPGASTPSNTVSIKLRAGRARLSATASFSPAGLLAVGGLVSGILLSTAVLVWASTTPVRRHPLLTSLARR
jgi:hypothetical protein